MKRTQEAQNKVLGTSFVPTLVGTEWVTLRDHVDDRSLGAAWSTATWPIQLQEERHGSGSADSPLRLFTSFRVIVTDKNSLGVDYELTLGGFEVYGDVYVTPT